MPQTSWFDLHKPQPVTTPPNTSWFDLHKPQIQAPQPPTNITAPKSYTDRLNDTYGLLDYTESAWNKIKSTAKGMYDISPMGQTYNTNELLNDLHKKYPNNPAAIEAELAKLTDPVTGEINSNLKNPYSLAKAGVTALDPTGIGTGTIGIGESAYQDIKNKDYGGLAATGAMAALPFLLHSSAGKAKPTIVPPVEPIPEHPWGSYTPTDFEKVVNERKNIPNVGESSPYPRQKQLPGRPESLGLPARGETSTYSPNTKFYQGKAGIVDATDIPKIDWTDPSVIDNLSAESGQVNPANPMDVAERGYAGLGTLKNIPRFNPETNIPPDYIDESPNVVKAKAGVIKPSDRFTESLNEAPNPRKKPGVNQVVGTRVQDRLLYQNEPASLPYGTVNQSGFGVAPKPFRLIPYADTPFSTEAGVTEPIVGEKPFELGSRETTLPQGEPRPVRPPGKFKYKVTGNEEGEPRNIRLDDLLPSAEKLPSTLPKVEQPKGSRFITDKNKIDVVYPDRQFLTKAELKSRQMRSGGLPKVEPPTTIITPKVETPVTPEPTKQVGLFGRAKQAVGKVSSPVVTGVDTELARLGDSGKKISKILRDAKTESTRYAGEYAVDIRKVERSLSKTEKAELGKAFTGDTDPSKLSPKAKNAYDTLKKSTNELESQAGKGSLGFDTSIGDEKVKDLNSLRQYQANLAREITHTERFTNLDNLIRSTSDPERAARLVDHALGKGRPALDSNLQSRTYKRIANVEGATHLQQFGITNLGDLADFPGVFGAKNTARAIAETFASPHESVDFSTRTGAQQPLYSGETSDLGSKFNKLTGGKAVEKLNRTVGSKAGRYAVQDFFERAKQNPAKYSDRLARFVDGDVSEVLKQDELTPKQLDFASNRGTELTSGSPDRLTLPRSFNPKNALLKIPTLYKRFAFLKLKNISDTIKAQPTMAGKIAKLSAIAGTNLAAGEVIGDTKKAISGLVNGNVSDKIRDRGDYIDTGSTILDRILADALQSSLFGLAGDVSESLMSGKRNKISGFVGGPVASDVDELANSIASIKSGNYKPITKYGLKRLPIPFIGSSLGDIVDESKKSGLHKFNF